MEQPASCIATWCRYRPEAGQAAPRQCVIAAETQRSTGHFGGSCIWVRQSMAQYAKSAHLAQGARLTGTAVPGEDRDSEQAAAAGPAPTGPAKPRRPCHIPSAS